MQSVASTYPEKSSRNIAPRVFAVVALIVVGIVVVALVSGAMKNSGSGTSTQKTPATHASSGPKDPFYVVKAGDNFTTIAHAEGIGVGQIKSLNPNLDSQQLQPQNCVDLTPNGCRKLANGG